VFTDYDHLLSLDTDIMLDEPNAIEAMLEAVDNGYDVAAVRTSFHQHAEWTYNAGYLGNPKHHPREALEAGRPEDLGTWPWHRAKVDQRFVHEGIQPIDIPMGCVMMSRPVFDNVRYRWHQGGEDIGFGVNLSIANFKAGWIPSIGVRHVWDRYAL
jgi:hypothetical protein